MACESANQRRLRPSRGEVHVWVVGMRERDGGTRDKQLWRVILSEYTGVRPEELRLSTGAFGKPRLLEPGAVQFNVTATDRHLFIAVASDIVGIDAEPISRLGAAYLRWWTAREAVTKAIGCGVGQEVDLDLDADDLRLERLGHDDPGEWSLLSCTLQGALVTVAVRSPNACLTLLEAPSVEACAS